MAEIGVRVGTSLLIYGVDMGLFSGVKKAVKSVASSITGGDLLSAGTSIVGGLLNSNSVDASNANALKINRENYEMQKEFAQNGIRWKVADAKVAGLHPLAALGSSTVSYTPSQVGQQVNTALGDSLSSIGQNLSRSIGATMTRREREEQRRKADLIQGMQLANQEAELKSRLASTASQIKLNDAHARYFEAMASVAGQPRNPPFPAGGAMTALQETPKRIDVNQAGTENVVGDSNRYLENPDGTLSIAPGKEHSLAAQDMDIPLGGNMYNMAWMYDTYLKPWAAGFLPGYKPRETVYKGQVYRYRRYTGRMHPTGIYIRNGRK